MTSGDASGYPRGYDFPSHPRQKEAAVRTADAETQRKIVNRLKPVSYTQLTLPTNREV